MSDKRAIDDIEIHWTIAGGESDFVATSGTTVLEKDKKAFSFLIETMNDNLYEPTKEFVLHIYGEDKSVENSLYVKITLLDDDPQYALGFDSSVINFNEGDGSVNLPVSLNMAHTSDLTVEYIVAGTATEGIDYNLVGSGLAFIPAGQNSVNIILNILEDQILEGTETILLTIYSISGGEAGGEVSIGEFGSLVVNIMDNDIAMSPSAGYILPGEILNFTVSGGEGSYIYSIIGAANSTINSNGQLTAAGTPESFSVRVEDGQGAFFISPIEVIDPKLNADLGLWLKADALSLSDNVAVETWLDETPNGNDFSQATAGNRPVFKTNVLNNKPSLRFDGVDDYLISSYLPVTGAGKRSVTAVLTNIFGKVDDSVVFSWGGTNSWGNSFGLNVLSPTLSSRSTHSFAIYTHLSGAYPSAFVAPQESKPYLVTTEYDGADIKFIINGEEAHQTTAALNTTSVNNMRIGSRFNQGFYKGDVAEILTFQNELDSGVRKKMECYLSRKYSLPVKNGLDCGTSALTLNHDGFLTVQTTQNLPLEAVGGVKPYHFSLISGSGNIDSSTGIFTAPSFAETNRVRVSDVFGQGLELDIHVTEFPRPATWLDLEVLTHHSDNDSIEFVVDKSGNKANYVQRSPAHQPIYKSGVLNSRPVMQFNGGQFLSGGFKLPTGSAPRTLVAVINASNSGSIFGYGDGWGCSQRFELKFSNVDGFVQFLRQCQTYSTSAVTNTDAKILVLRYTGTQLIIHENGSQVFSSAVGLSTSGVYGFKLGSTITGSSDYFNGQIAEVMGFDSSLSDTEREKVEAYLSTKFGIAL